MTKNSDTVFKKIFLSSQMIDFVNNELDAVNQTLLEFESNKTRRTVLRLEDLNTGIGSKDGTDQPSARRKLYHSLLSPGLKSNETSSLLENRRTAESESSSDFNISFKKSSDYKRRQKSSVIDTHVSPYATSRRPPQRNFKSFTSFPLLEKSCKISPKTSKSICEQEDVYTYVDHSSNSVTVKYIGQEIKPKVSSVSSISDNEPRYFYESNDKHVDDDQDDDCSNELRFRESNVSKEPCKLDVSRISDCSSEGIKYNSFPNLLACSSSSLNKLHKNLLQETSEKQNKLSLFIKNNVGTPGCSLNNSCDLNISPSPENPLNSSSKWEINLANEKFDCLSPIEISPQNNLEVIKWRPSLSLLESLEDPSSCFNFDSICSLHNIDCDIAELFIQGKDETQVNLSKKVKIKKRYYMIRICMNTA